MTFLDLFSGIGGFRLGMTMAGHTCLGHCEIDKFANKSYFAMYDTEGEWFAEDINQLQPEDTPKADAWCFGFPCQNISVAGKGAGLDGERSGLFFTVTDLIRKSKEEDRPSYLIIENVKNLFSVNKGFDFARVLLELDEIGYDAEWQLFNTADYLPQNRERVYIIGHLRTHGTRKVFPISGTIGKARISIIGHRTGFRRNMQVFAPNGITEALDTAQGGGRGPHTICEADHTSFLGDVENSGMAIPVLTPFRPNKRQNGRRFKENGEPMFTLTSQDRHGVMIDGYRIRKLTPLECFRLQGFPDELFYKAQAVNSDSQLYKQAGNAVSVPVVLEIAKRLRIAEVKN